MARSSATATPTAGPPRPAKPGWPVRRVRREQALAVLVGWLLGVASVLGGAMLTGGWYEYFVPESESQVRQMVNQQGWELVSESGELYLRRPRVRFPSIRGPVPAGEVAWPTSPAVSPRPTPAAESRPAQAPVSLSGTPAVQQTEPFHLVEGSYRVEWSAAATPERNCSFRPRLYMVGEEGTAIDVVSRAVSTGQTAQGATFLHNISAGPHYLDLTPIAGERCRWTLTLTHR